MKKNILIQLFIVCSFALFAQSDGINYQAVILDSEALQLPGQDLVDNYLANGEVSLRFSIYDHYDHVIYQEVQSTTTDAYGLINMVIGLGEQSAGSSTFLTIDWDGNPKDLGVELSYTAENFEELSRQALLFLPYAFHRNITASGTLIVAGPTLLYDDLNVGGNAQFNGNTTFNSIIVENQSNLNGDVLMGSSAEVNGYLAVNNGSQTLLTGPLNVEGNSSLQNGLNVTGMSSLNGNLNVTNESSTSLSGTLNVTQAATFNDNVSVSKALNVAEVSNLNGQVTIDAGLTGTSDSNYGHYALRVQGANEGIAIKLNNGRNASKNFLNFQDAYGIQGCIEGQTSAELNSSFRFIWDNVMAGLDEGFAVAEAVACAGQLDGWEVASNGLQAVAAYAQWIELADYGTSNVGVNFSSGGADYAEWLERENAMAQLYPGQVVGIFAGKISLRTEGAHELKVISTNPIVLGNMPEIGRKELYERVALLGQAPVRVVGLVNEGDYILPSGENDGLAKAFAVKDVPTSRFNEIIGVAWEIGASTGMNVVNVAIGLNANDMATKVSELENEVSEMRLELENIKRMINGETPLENANSNEPSELVSQKDTPTSVQFAQRLMTDEEFEIWLSQNASTFENIMAEKKEFLKSIGSDYSAYPEAVVLLESPIQALRDMRSGKYMESLWQNLEQKIQKK